MIVKSVVSHALACCALVSSFALAEPGGDWVNVVAFSKGSAILSGAEVIRLRDLVSRLDAQGGKKRVYVAAWADQELPPDGREALGNDSVKLAATRADRVTEALRKLRVKGSFVEVNLAKNPDTLQELFHTKKAEVGNRALHESQTGKGALDEAGDVIRSHGGPSKVVIFIQQ